MKFVVAPEHATCLLEGVLTYTNTCKDCCYFQESIYSQDNNLMHLIKADGKRVTQIKLELHESHL